MQAVEQRLLELRAKRCVLEVAIDDAGAQEFYASRGYKVDCSFADLLHG